MVAYSSECDIIKATDWCLSGREDDMREKKVWSFRAAILVAAVIAAIIMVNQYMRSIEAELKNEMQVTLHDVAEQTSTILRREIESEQDLLVGLAKELAQMDPENEEIIMETLTPLAEISQLKRLGIIDSQGIAYTTDGYVQDIGFREFYRKAMEGKQVVSDVIIDTIGEKENINVFSVPIYDKTNDVAGVLFATFQTSKFRELMNVESFGGRGYSYVVKRDGTVIADSKLAAMYGAENMFTVIRNYDPSNKEAVEQMMAYAEKDESGFGSYRYEGERYYYCMPLNLTSETENGVEGGQWYVFTIVPAEVLNERLNPIMYDVQRMIVVMIVILVAAVLLYLLSYQERRRELMKLAYVDPLTEGDNYVCFVHKITEKKNLSGYLVSMDMGEFKIINSTCGIAKGDEVLRCIWGIICNNIREQELATHVNADRFVLYLQRENREKLVELLVALKQEITALSVQLNVPKAVPYYGIYEVTKTEPVEQLYSFANQAKQLVKGRRDRCYCIYEEVDYEQILRNKELEDNFDEALKTRQFEVWYQPKFDTQNSKIVGAEALVRWRRADGTMIARLDEYVFETVCSQQKRWEREGKPMMPISINISRVSLYYAHVASKYKKIRDDYDLDSRYVQLEITESATINNSDIQKLIRQFHEAGFELLLDDFGVGYSSLASLNTMKFDTLKLDKSLIDYIGNDSGEKLLYYTIRLAKSLGLKITAEGVEQETQVNFLRKHQCDNIQGFYFSRPLPLSEFEKLVA